MGCLGSRDSQRQGMFENTYWNLPYAFRKTAKTNGFALGPYNALAAGYIGDTSKDLSGGALGECKDLKFADAKDALEKEATVIFDLCKKSYEYAAGISDDKDDGFQGTFKPSVAKEELNVAMTAMAECFEKLTWPEKAEGDKEDKPEEKKEGEEEKKEDAVEAEGGDEKKDDAAAVASDPKAAEFPKVLLEQYIKSPVLASIIKSAVMQTELDGFDLFAFDKLGKAMAFFLPKPTEWASCDAILSMLVDSKEDKEEKELFGKMKFADMDLAELEEAFTDKDNMAVVLPGISIWETSADACKNVTGPDASSEFTLTLQKAKAMDGKDFGAEGKFVINRIVTKVTAFDKEAKTATLEFWDELFFTNIGEAKAYFDAAAAGTAAAPVAAEADKKPEEEEKKKEEEDAKE